MSLLAWYPLLANGNNQGLDEENLTTVGAVTYTKGKLGNAAKFTGNSGVRFRRSNFTEQTNWSVSAWVKCDEATSAAQWCFNNGRDGNNDGWHCWFSAAGTTLYLRIGSSSWSMTSTLGTWYHVTMTIDENSKYTFYVNGEQKSTGTVTTLPDYSESGNLMAIGGFVYNGGNIYPLNGQVQDFRYYNHCLSKKEVKELAKGLCMNLPLDWGGNPNLAINSQTLNGFGGKSQYTGTNSNSLVDGVRICRSECTADSNGGPYCSVFSRTSTIPAVNGTTYTWSMYIRGNREMIKNVGHECGGIKAVTITTEWQYVTHTWTYSTSNYQAIVFYGNSSDRQWKTGDWIEIKQLKIEEGSIATPYIPNTAEAIYTSKGFGNNYLMDCSGYNNEVKAIGSNNTSCTSPKGLGGTTCGASSCINLGTAPKIQYPLTIAFWFNTSDLSVNNNRLISCTESGGWNIEASSTNLRWTIGTGTSSNTYKYCDSTKTLTQLQDAWHHIVCTYNGLKAQMYIDGTLEKEVTHYTTATPIYYNNNNAVFLCGEAGSNATTPATTYTVDTSVSDFRMYATCLSADDIKELYSIPIQIDKSGKLYCGSLVEV